LNPITIIWRGITQAERLSAGRFARLFLLKRFSPDVKQPAVSLHQGTASTEALHYRTALKSMFKTISLWNLGLQYKGRKTAKDFFRKIISLLIVLTMPTVFFGTLFKGDFHPMFAKAETAAFFFLAFHFGHCRNRHGGVALFKKRSGFGDIAPHRRFDQRAAGRLNFAFGFSFRSFGKRGPNSSRAIWEFLEIYPTCQIHFFLK
jgi:hypothetical protein